MGCVLEYKHYVMTCCYVPHERFPRVYIHKYHSWGSNRILDLNTSQEEHFFNPFIYAGTQRSQYKVILL